MFNILPTPNRDLIEHPLIITHVLLFLLQDVCFCHKKGRLFLQAVLLYTFFPIEDISIFEHTLIFLVLKNPGEVVI
ncbi:hypothetical protein SAMN04488112_11848 [Melghirimyces thermohalophilus]|uniref:Uncharacterized protein n=1 Tax=Melghirimyces thermohalophilus TaxID=1236220 RepID=A0A1G6PU94_9BACL|nr:hypothetical protein SAMN04488112_11848 [Melghirimyces thermohalophilus]